MSLHLQKTKNTYVIASFKIPRDGTQYGLDIKAFFPETTWDSIFGKDPEAYNRRAQTLGYEVEGDSMVYYGVISPGSPRPTYTPMQ